MAKKILWICNKEYIVNNEIDLLTRLGYEFYIPNISPLELNVISNNQNVNSVVLPKEDLTLLDETDFYYNKISDDVMNVLNSTFDIVVFGLYIEPIISFVEKFRGIMIARPYGDINFNSYTDFLIRNAGMWLIEKIARIGNRFWITKGYLHWDITYECETLKKRTIALPFCLGEEMQNKSDSCNGMTLFCCDNIKISESAEKDYQLFSKTFQNFPYIIAGIQPICVDDDKQVRNCTRRKEVLVEIGNCSAVFCKDIHFGEIPEYYYEAIKSNIPIIFLKKSNIKKFFGDNFVGGCRNIEQAKRELKHISNDLSYREKISRAQADYLKSIRTENVLEIWRDSFNYVNEVKENNTFDKKQKKLGIIALSFQRNDDSFQNATKLVTAIKHNEGSDGVEIVFGCQMNKDEKNITSTFDNFEKREFYLEEVSKDRVEEIIELKDYKVELPFDTYYLINDGIQYFNDCDYLIFVGEMPKYPIFVTKPYGILVAEKIDNSVLMSCHCVGFFRFATAIFGFNNYSLNEFANCIGIPQKKCHRIPLFFKNDRMIKAYDKSEKKFVIIFSKNAWNNYNFFFATLIKFYNSGGNMKCLIATQNFNSNNKERKAIKELVISNPSLKRNISIVNFLSLEDIMSEISRCSFGLYPCSRGNNDILFRALANGTPFIINDVPELREFIEAMSLKEWSIDFTNSTEFVDKLFEFEKKHIMFSRELEAKREFFNEFTLNNPSICKNIYDIVLNNAYINV